MVDSLDPIKPIKDVCASDFHPCMMLYVPADFLTVCVWLCLHYRPSGHLIRYTITIHYNSLAINPTFVNKNWTLSDSQCVREALQLLWPQLVALLYKTALHWKVFKPRIRLNQLYMYLYSICWCSTGFCVIHYCMNEAPLQWCYVSTLSLCVSGRR